MSAWISVEDRLPETCTLVLAYFTGGTFSIAGHYAGSEFPWDHSLDNPHAEPTHWQPLPAPPEES